MNKRNKVIATQDTGLPNIYSPKFSPNSYVPTEKEQLLAEISNLKSDVRILLSKLKEQTSEEEVKAMWASHNEDVRNLENSLKFKFFSLLKFVFLKVGLTVNNFAIKVAEHCDKTQDDMNTKLFKDYMVLSEKYPSA